MRSGNPNPISWRVLAGWLAALFLIAVSAVLSSRMVRDQSSSAGQRWKESADRRSLSSEFSRRPALALGFRNFLADMVWLEAVQVAGSRQMTEADYDCLYRLVDTTINLDPKFEMPPLLGGIILGDSAAHAGESLKVLKRGWASHTSDWRYPFYMGYVLYFSVGNPDEAGKMVMQAARIPGSAPYLPLLASRMLSEGRDPNTALVFLSEMMKQETNPARREALEKRIREVIVERDLRLLESAVKEYRRLAGRLPGDLHDLAAFGLIREVPREPNGGRYVMMPDGEVRSDRVSEHLKVFRNK